MSAPSPGSPRTLPRWAPSRFPLAFLPHAPAAVAVVQAPRPVRAARRQELRRRQRRRAARRRLDADQHRRVAVPDRRLLRDGIGVQAGLRAVGDGRQRGGRHPRPPGQADDPQRRQLAQPGRHQLPDADQLRSRGPDLRPVLLAADHAGLGGGGPQRVRVRRGRGRRAVGLRHASRTRPTTTSSTCRCRSRTSSCRSSTTSRACRPSQRPKTAAYPIGGRPVRRPAGAARPAEADGARREDRVHQGLPRGKLLLQAGGRPGGRRKNPDLVVLGSTDVPTVAAFMSEFDAGPLHAEDVHRGSRP